MDAMTDPALYAICAACGGYCCRHMAGEAFPEDVDPALDPAALLAGLTVRLVSGQWMIDWWEGHPEAYDPPWPDDEDDALDIYHAPVRGYYLRPRVDSDPPDAWMHPSWSGRCVFHTDAGCSLPYARRPRSCRALAPRADGHCVMPEDAGKRQAAIAWLPYHDLIEEATKRAAAMRHAA